MNRADDPFAELREILEALVEERITSEQSARFVELTRHDAAARRFYLEYIELHGNLHWDAAQSEIGLDRAAHCSIRDVERQACFARPAATGSSRANHPAKRRSRLPFAMTIAVGSLLAVGFLAAAWISSGHKTARPKSGLLVEGDEGARQPGPVSPANSPGPRPKSALKADAAAVKANAAAKRTTNSIAAVRRRSSQARFPVTARSPKPGKSTQHAPDQKTEKSLAVNRITGTQTPLAVSNEASQELISFIDEHIQGGWKSAGLEPSPVATDAEWIRRVSLDVVGHIPPEEAVDAFLDAHGERKKTAVVEHLLQDPGYARNWGTVWANLLVGRDPPTPGVHRDELEKYLRDSFAANVPWNEIVYSLVAAEGTAEQNPAANFLLAHLNQDAVPATALTARLFLGIQVQCTQCHDHPFTKDKQDRFWELNSFFQQTEVVSSHSPLPSGSSSAAGDSSEGRSMTTRPISLPEIVTRQVGGPMYYETLRGEMRAAFPIYAGHKIDVGPTVNRRRELGRLISQGDDRQLALAMVNRTWQHFFGHGFTRPVDDMGPHNVPNNPEVLDRLAREFAASGYNVKQLIQWICATDAYQRASTFDRANTSDDPANGAPPLFSRLYLKPLSAEALYDSLMVATRAKASARTDWNDVGRRREDWVRQFVFNYATEDRDEAALPAGSVTQALTMMNDRIVDGALAIEPGTLLFDVVHDTIDDAAKIRRLSRSALSRNPTQAELHAAVDHLREAREGAESEKGQQQAAGRALADIFWAYLNSNEFALVH
jgi:Protein of unknown function (DUF1549)/Protein of unknown function (DUF1553)